MKPVIIPKHIIHSFNLDGKLITITTMTTSDLEFVLTDWALREQWYPTRHMAVAGMAADPGGYYLLYVDNEPVASLACVCYHEIKTAFLGLYIVVSTHRGKQYGKLLWDTITRPLLQQGYALSLNALPDKIDIYKRANFEIIHNDETWRYTQASLPQEAHTDISIAELTTENLAAVLNYDANIVGCQRTNYLHNWMTKPETYTAVATREEQLSGFGVMSARLSPRINEEAGFRIGPVYANDSETAEQIIYHLLSKTDKRPVILDIPGNNRVLASNVITKLGFEKYLEFTFMSTQPYLHAQGQHVFAKSSLSISAI